MAKIIKLTPEIIEETRKSFEEALLKAKLSDGKISFTKSFGTVQRKATVYFTEIAWQKMQTLIREFDKEVAWHGLAYRGEDPTKDEYTITDILVYPQEVTGATVTSDQEKYQSWLMEHDDEVFNNIRMQGHSHVNMSVTPSSVDLALYEKILEQLDDTMFYIFLIYNKSGSKTYMIYDMAKNVLFETADVTVEIIGDDTGLTSFLKDAKEKVKNRVYQYPSYSGGQTAPGYSGGAVGSRYYPQPVGTSPKPATAAPVSNAPKVAAAPTVTAKSEERPGSKKNGFQSGKSGKRKGKRRKGGTGVIGGKSAASTGKKSSFEEEYEGFDDDDLDGPFGFRENGYFGNGFWR